MKTGRKIIFWAFRNRPSFIMRGLQISQELSNMGMQAEVRHGVSFFALSDVKDSIIVCIKSCPVFSPWMKKNRNKIVYDAIDYNPVRGLPGNMDAIVTGTKHMQEYFESATKRKILIRTIYHHADDQLKPHHAGEQSLKLVYNGELDQSNFLRGEIPELNVRSFRGNPNWREEMLNFNAHFSARMDSTKSVIKLANVARLKAVFLTGKEPGCVELLGQDYPFFLRDYHDLTKVKEDVLALKDSIGGQTWRNAHERIQHARLQLTISASAAHYKKLFEELP